MPLDRFREGNRSAGMSQKTCHRVLAIPILGNKNQGCIIRHFLLYREVGKCCILWRLYPGIQALIMPFRFLIIFTCFLTLSIRAQEGSDSLWQYLPEVQVKSERTLRTGAGALWLHVDGSLQNALQGQSLAEVLASSTGMYLRQYGAGKVASASMQGGSAAQTALLWHGLYLNSPLLGQADLGLIPAGLFQQVQVQEGGQSSAWGHGAVAGSIHLEEEPAVPDSLHRRLRITAGYSNQGMGFHHLELLKAQRPWLIKTRGAMRKGPMNYRYPLSNGFNRLPHNGLAQYHVLQDLVWTHGAHRVGLYAWWQYSKRELPPTLTETTAEAVQQDNALRLLLTYQYQWDHWSLETRAAYLKDALHYQDLPRFLDQHNSARTLPVEVQLRRVFPHGILELVSDTRKINGKVSAYGPEAITQWRHTISVRYTHSHPKPGLQWTLQGNTGSNGAQWQPFSPSIGLEWRRKQWLLTGFQAGAHFRWPSFDDLYWTPGGSRTLNPERGLSVQPWIMVKKMGTWHISAYYRKMEQWIQWLPGPQFWSAVNLPQVLSRGWHTRWEHTLPLNHWKLGLNASASYTRSSYQKERFSGDGALGKQLIYTPIWQTSALAKAEFRFVNLWARAYHYSRSYVLSDNSEWLPAQWLCDAGINWTWKAWQLSGSMLNIFNQPYQSVLNRPMPGINFQMSLTWQWQSIKTN